PPRAVELLRRAQFPRALGAPPAAAAALAARLADDVVQVILAVIIGDLFARLDRPERVHKHAALTDGHVRIRIAGMVEVARDIAARRAVDGRAAVHLEQVTVALRL